MKQHIHIHKAEPNRGILDYSHLLDAPAGKHGFVETRNGHLYFEDGRHKGEIFRIQRGGKIQHSGSRDGG